MHLTISEGTHGDVLEALNCEIQAIWKSQAGEYVATVKSRIDGSIVSEASDTVEINALNRAIEEAAEKGNYKPEITDPIEILRAEMATLRKSNEAMSRRLEALQGTTEIETEKTENDPADLKVVHETDKYEFPDDFEDDEEGPPPLPPDFDTEEEQSASEVMGKKKKKKK